MTSLRTTYLGVELKNPIVVGACSLSKKLESIKAAEDAGAGGMVIKSLFEEAIQIERGRLMEELTQYDAMYAEAISMFPSVEHGGPKEHLHWVEKARKATNMPLFASLNAVNEEVWVDYARQLAETGVDGLELNFYSPPIDPDVSSDDIERQEIETFAKVREAVKIPLAVKLHPSYTNLSRVAMGFDKAGADGLVLFNRLFQPDVDIETEEEAKTFQLSSPDQARYALRWVALLHGRVNADLIASGGISEGGDAIKMILAGATAVQVVSTLYRHNVEYIGTMLADMEAWMQRKGYENLEAFRGKISKRRLKDAWAYERGQYIKALLGFD